MRVRKEKGNGWETGNPRSRAQKRINPTEKKKQINVIRNCLLQHTGQMLRQRS